MFKYFESRLPPYPPAEPHLPPKDFMAFVWDCTRGLRSYVVAMAALSAAIAVFEALLFAVLGHVVDWLSTVAPHALWAEHKGAILGIVALLMGTLVLVSWQTSLKHQVLAINFPLRLRWNFHRLMLGQSMAFYADEFAGRITTKIMQTALAVRDMIFTTTDVVIGMGIYLVTILVLLAGFDARLLLPFAAWMVAYGLACWYFVPRLGQVGKQQADARSVMTGRITDAYTNIATVKLFSHTRRESEFARAAMDAFKLTGYAQMRLVSLFEIVNQLLVVAMILGACGTALWLWSAGEVGAGAVAAVTAMTLRVSGHAHWVMWEMTTLFESVGTIQDGINTLTRPRTVVDAPDAKPLVVTQGEVRFEDMSFAYGSGPDARPVIDRLNLTIRPGEKIGLIGRSGAGKSTLVNLLLRFHDVQSGRIVIDGQDIAHVTQDSLRRSIGMVTQDTSLLHRSMRDNILYGRPDASEADLHQAAARAEAADFIATLTDLQGRTGYDAHVGERGVKLSGGQRQRLAIARALLKDAPVLILDEATSALDTESERQVQAALDVLMKNRTTLVIAHRLSTIERADRIVVMDKGRIAEIGCHADLLAAGGLYANLYNSQLGSE